MNSAEIGQIEQLKRENRLLRESIKHVGCINKEWNRSLSNLRKHHHKAIGQTQEYLRRLVDGIDFPIYTVKSDLYVDMMNRKACECCSLNPGPDENLFCKDVFFFCDGKNCAKGKCFVEDVFKSEKGKTFVKQCKVHGKDVVLQVRVTPMTVNGKTDSVIVFVVDITEQVTIENMLEEKKEEIFYMAHYDALTGLPNRFAISRHIEDCILRCRQEGTRFFLFFMDIDNFKKINDVYGHDVGDAFLCEFSNYLKEVLRSDDFVGRFGGDEFIVVTQVNSCRERVGSIGKRLLDVKENITRVGKSLFWPTVSVGISSYPEDGLTMKELLKKADVAMYASKAAGGSHCTFYTEDLCAPTRESLCMERSLSRAMEMNELQLYYQPQLNFCTGDIEGAEALLRWISPSLGLVMPGIFIPMAEDMHIITDIGNWVMHTACREARKWRGKLAGKRVCANLSVQQFFEGNLIDSIQSALEESGLEPERLELEITESLLMQNPDRAIDIMRQISQFGVKLSLDDFGTGYSSLAYLARFPMHRLKIDKSFVDNLPSDGASSVIVKGIIGLAQNMDMEIIAEGIEREEQAQVLKHMECYHGQGFLFSRPIPMDQLQEQFGN